MYTQSSIDRVREVDIVQVISHYLDLKKEGSNYTAKSPFKEERTGSFKVSPSKQIFKCFATDQAGDAIKFVQLHERLSFIDAIKTIAGNFNIVLEEEEASEERKKHLKTAESLKELSTNIASEYARQFSALDSNHWAKKMLEDRGYTQDTIIEFQLGYAPGNLVSKAAIKSGKLELAKEIGLVKTKLGVSYDFFKDRITFPIHNRNGQIIAFGGRRSNDEEAQSYPKYINSPESAIYNKSFTLYGLHQAQRHIIKLKYAVLVEGYTDVISLHHNGAVNTIATCGTALTKEQAKILKTICNHVIIFRDGDSAGIKAAMRDLDILLSVGLKVSVCLPEPGEDPDSMCRKEGINIVKYLEAYSEDALLWKAEYLYEAKDDLIIIEKQKEELLASVKDNNLTEAELKEQFKTLDDKYESIKTDPNNIAIALDNLNDTFSKIESEIIRKEYIKKVASLFKQPARTIEKQVKAHLSNIEEQAIKRAKSNSFSQEDVLGLPKGADMEQYIQDRFAIVGNTYYFQGKEGFFKGTNHRIQPLFHIYGRSDNKRLCEVVNELGQKRLIDFESKDFINFAKIQEKLIEEGFFVWMPSAQNIHFKLVAQKTLNDFIMAYELKTLGWQKEGFFAFADGAYYKGSFQHVNKYGIQQIETEDTKTEEECEYGENIKHFYSPAFSEIYKTSREDDDPYENDRCFVYKKSPVSFSRWMALMCKVYKEKGRIAISFALSTIFRDHIIARYSFFPHLFLTGEKGSGKSKFGDSIANLFTYKLSPFDLNSGTLVGFYRRLARIKNVPVFFEEFHDKIDDRMFQSLKGAYDGRGREKGSMTSDNRTSISKINSSCILAGQYLSNRDDNSLTSRSVILHFIKNIENFSNEEVEDYNLLKAWEEEGLSSLILDVLEYRSLIEQNFHNYFAKNLKRFKTDLQNFEYQERMLMNYNALYTPLQILHSCFEFPFELEDFYTQCFHGIIDNSDLIIESEGMSEFWRVLEHLLKHNQIKEGFDFVIDTPIDVKINPSKNKVETYKNSDRHKILFLRLSSVHQEYHKEVSKRDGVDVIGEATIRNYFKSKKYFIAPKSAHRFNDGVKSCYLFDYDMMRNQGILNLETSLETDASEPKSKYTGDDPPY